MTTSTSDSTYDETVVSIRGTNCMVHRWHPNNNPSSSSSPKAVVVIFHGFLAHGAYPTVRYAAEFLAEAGYAVVATDFPGHGKSEGMRGYLRNADELVEDGVAQTQHALSLYKESAGLPLVLCGSSMGGAIALSVAHKLKGGDSSYSGKDPLLILMAPMLKLNVSSLERTALQCLDFLAPTAQLIPSSATDASKQYRDETKRKECQDDELTVSGAKLRVSSALTCVDVTLQLRNNFASIANPYLLLIADEDVVVKNEGSDDFYEMSASTDKTKKNYPALHGLLCEPSPLFDEIKNDILSWLRTRL
ncbi:acylglycerol lipase [Nitzschia inconspicua]|uniref:Acylglycerol lipase n=1 Tax=Nitzschia inconspicua TaxID=303405 RepID=A0A9K3LMP6_9STRA|nr:acylglycerol lipase [Nitzschia inconspicua]